MDIVAYIFCAISWAALSGGIIMWWIVYRAAGKNAGGPRVPIEDVGRMMRGAYSNGYSTCKVEALMAMKQTTNLKDGYLAIAALKSDGGEYLTSLGIIL